MGGEEPEPGHSVLSSEAPDKRLGPGARLWDMLSLSLTRHALGGLVATVSAF